MRQPLKRVLLPILDPSFKDQIEGVKDLILSEVNIKEIEYITDTTGLIKKKIKPNFKTLGRRLGPLMKEANQVIQDLSAEQIDSLEQTDALSLAIGGQIIAISLEDVVISSEDIPGWQVASDGEITVAVDIALDEKLIAEGTARELVNRIQNLRKQFEFEVTDRIVVRLSSQVQVVDAVEQFGGYIRDEVLAEEIQFHEQVNGEVIDLADNVQVQISLSLA